MSTKHFQVALAKIISDPALCRHYRQEPGKLLQDYELTTIEHGRLVHMISQDRMKVNSMLYQMNRFTPLVNFMPYTVKMLDNTIEEIVREFWSIYDQSPFQFMTELGLFISFIRQKISEQAIRVPYLADMLTFEEAFADIRFRNMEYAVPNDASTQWSLHPSARVIHMQHDLIALLDAVVDAAPGALLPEIEPEDGYYILKYINDIELTGIPEEVAHYFTMNYPPDSEDLLLSLQAKGFIQ